MVTQSRHLNKKPNQPTPTPTYEDIQGWLDSYEISQKFFLNYLKIRPKRLERVKRNLLNALKAGDYKKNVIARISDRTVAGINVESWRLSLFIDKTGRGFFLFQLSPKFTDEIEMYDHKFSLFDWQKKYKLKSA